MNAFEWPMSTGMYQLICGMRQKAVSAMGGATTLTFESANKNIERGCASGLYMSNENTALTAYRHRCPRHHEHQKRRRRREAYSRVRLWARRVIDVLFNKLNGRRKQIPYDVGM